MNQEALQQLARIGMLSRIWPASRVLLGMATCKWLRQDLPDHVENVMIVCRGKCPNQTGAVDAGSTEIGNTLLRLHANALYLQCDGTNVDLLLRGVSEAIAAAWRTRGDCHIRLATLDLRQNSMDDASIGRLSSMLGSFTGLVRLDLSGHCISEDAAGKLSRGLRMCKDLQHLDLSDNRKYPMLGAEGAGLIANGVSGCKHLRFLDLSRNLIGDEGAKQLAAEIGGCISLTHLGLAWNRLVHEGVASVAAALRPCASLTSLNLRGNFVGDEGARRLAAVLAEGDWTLRHLDLSDNEIGEDGARSLSELRRQCRSLQFVDLSHNQIADVGGQFSSSCPSDLDMNWH